MGNKYNFKLQSSDKRSPVSGKIIIGRDETETNNHVLLKFLAYVIFYRDRLQIEPRLHEDNIPFVPDLVQLDYQMRPALWVECGECSVRKLDKLAVKVPEAQIWLLKKSLTEMEVVAREMRKAGLRENRYSLLAFDSEIFAELIDRLTLRNEFHLYLIDLEEGEFQFDFNGYWYELEMEIWRI